MTSHGSNSMTRSGGLTLIELLVSIAVLAVLTSLAAPSFTSYIDRTRLTTAVDALNADLQLARSEALRTNQTVGINFQTGSAWCYGAVLGSTSCDCSVSSAGAGYCDYKRVTASSASSVTMSSSTFASGTTSFDTGRGFLTSAGSVTLTSTQGKQARVSLSLMGTASVCSVSGLTTVYPAC